ncbi:MAG: phospholipase, partial [Spirosoma sp.]|nr:phospholipase [Spirosoma sp.]
MPDNQLHHDLLYTALTTVFGEFDASLFSQIKPKLQWVEISGGETLFKQNDPANSMYMVISGRLEVFLADPDGHSKKIGEVMRGGIVGEMSILTDQPIWATVIALRDSILVRVSKQILDYIISVSPGVLRSITRLVIERLRYAQAPKKLVKKKANICLLALHETIDLLALSQNLQQLIRHKGTVYLASREIVDKVFSQRDETHTSQTDEEAHWQLSNWLNEQESKHDFLLLIADKPTPEGQYSTWTKRCLRAADEILLIADALQSPEWTKQEKQNQHELGRTETLVLLHPIDTVIPHHTARWLQNRPRVKNHYHIRLGLSRDMERLARILSGTANGLVLAGGGAKGFAHLGVLKALLEFHIPIDFVGGTSVGGLMAGIISFDQPVDMINGFLKKAALRNPTGDYNWIPLISLVRGKRMEQLIQATIQDFFGHLDTDVEDSWLTLFMLSSNYTQAREEIHTRGPLVKYLKATSAIPGVFPPVIDGDDLLVDGGAFNNFPVDVMSRMPVGKVIGVDLKVDKIHKMVKETMPNSNELLRDRLRPKRLRKYHFPSLISIMHNATLLSSAGRRN